VLSFVINVKDFWQNNYTGMVCHNQGNLISKKKYMVEPFANSFPAFADDRFQ